MGARRLFKIAGSKLCKLSSSKNHAEFSKKNRQDYLDWDCNKIVYTIFKKKKKKPTTTAQLIPTIVETH